MPSSLLDLLGRANKAAPQCRSCALCPRPAAYAFSTCCRTCEASSGKSHGPKREAANAAGRALPKAFATNRRASEPWGGKSTDEAQPTSSSVPAQIGIVQNRERTFPDVVLWSLDHTTWQKMPNGEPVNIVATSDVEFKVVWRCQEGWVKKHHLQLSEASMGAKLPGNAACAPKLAERAFRQESPTRSMFGTAKIASSQQPRRLAQEVDMPAQARPSVTDDADEPVPAFARSTHTRLLVRDGGRTSARELVSKEYTSEDQWAFEINGADGPLGRLANGVWYTQGSTRNGRPCYRNQDNGSIAWEAGPEREKWVLQIGPLGVNVYSNEQPSEIPPQCGWIAEHSAAIGTLALKYEAMIVDDESSTANITDINESQTMDDREAANVGLDGGCRSKSIVAPITVALLM